MFEPSRCRHALRTEGIHYLVMEFVPGETLAQLIARGPLPLEDALDLFRQIAAALEVGA